MPLDVAHEGYEYQDLLTCYFILKQLLNGINSTFVIDRKDFGTDKFDDLTIITDSRVFKKQSKYSKACILEKKYLSSSTSYNLEIDALYKSWLNTPNRDACEVRLCLAWSKPVDELLQVLTVKTDIEYSFDNTLTTIYQINCQKLWPKGQTPLSSWRRFKKVSQQIRRELFETFCSLFVIEVDFPKFSVNLYNPGQLETIVLEQFDRLGIGEYPNAHLNREEAALKLTHLIKESRTKGTTKSIDEIIQFLRIRTDYGSIEQIFPINHTKNIRTENFVQRVYGHFEQTNKIILTGEPGSGKSWLIGNLQEYLQASGITVIRHYCYTDLEDELQKERITLKVFYANLIAEIINAFPHLEEKKQAKYASNLTELNILLESIDEETLVIVDGLDHIQRIYSSHSHDLSGSEIDIIRKLNDLHGSDKVKFLVASQPISDLKQLSHFTEVKMPDWTITEVRELMYTYHLENHQVSDKIFLEDFLLERSSGNPLYLTYLIEEIGKIPSITINTLNELPPYSYNLSEYYGYLLKRLNTRESIPRILSGVNFSLTEQELDEITGEGERGIEEILVSLSAVLKCNYSHGGYIIYHESFRRYILENLEANCVSLYRVIFKPILEWMEEKGFYPSPKSFRAYLRLLHEYQRHEDILEYASSNFLEQSLFYGYSWDLIARNYTSLLKAALYKKDFPKIIELIEINRILATAQDEYDEAFGVYFEALGYLHGFKVVADYLTFEGKRTLNLQQGLQACYLCDIHEVNPPWELYLGYFDDKDGIPLDDFKYYIRCLLFLSDSSRIVSMATQLVEKDLKNYQRIFRNECIGYHDKGLINNLIVENSHVKSILNGEVLVDKGENIVDLAYRLLEFSSVHEEEVIQMNDFFGQLEFLFSCGNFNCAKDVIALFRGKNWFYNWVIYSIKIKELQYAENYKFCQLKEVFSFLIYDTAPFKGNPRTVDVYGARDHLYDSFDAGLKLIKSKHEWKEIIDILKKVSDETTTSLSNRLTGPLTPDRLLELLEKHVNSDNVDLIIDISLNIIEKERLYTGYFYLTEYYFRLSVLYSFKKEREMASSSLRRGIAYILSYTFRRDITLEELTESVNSMVKVDSALAYEYIKRIKVLADTVVQHTDGKDTKYFPIEWFEHYLTIDYDSSLIYLFNQLKETNYYWKLEACLRDSLMRTNGTISPLIELFVTRTFPVENSDDFLDYCLLLAEEARNIDYILARNFVGNIYTKAQIKDNYHGTYEKDFITRLSRAIESFGYEYRDDLAEKEKENAESLSHAPHTRSTLPTSSMHEPKMASIGANTHEIIQYYSDHDEYEFGAEELVSLEDFFHAQKQLTDELKELVQLLVFKYRWNFKGISSKLDALFCEESESSVYYWVCKFVAERAEWGKVLANTGAFEKAYHQDSSLAIKFLTELLERLLNEEGSKRNISANLINTFVKIQYDTKTITEMWKALYNFIDYRLPDKPVFDWDEALSNEYDFTKDELLICILFTRLRANSIERHNWALSGICYLLYSIPEKMVKPLKWFFGNTHLFLDITKLMILELLYDYQNKDQAYVDNFASDLEQIYPTDYYLIDYLIEKLLSKSFRRKTLFEKNFIYPIRDSEYFMLKSMNVRHHFLELLELDLRNIFGEILQTYQADKEYEHYALLYYRRTDETHVNNLYWPNYLLKLINQRLYNRFRECPKRYENELFHALKVDYRSLLAQYNSCSTRPTSAEKPSQVQYPFTKSSKMDISGDWVRIACYENELHKKDHVDKPQKYQLMAGVVFSDRLQEPIPYAKYRLNPYFIWNAESSNYDIDEFLIFAHLQRHDQFEQFKLLWINPELIKFLNLRPMNFLYGIGATDSNDDVVLKYNAWFSDYFGNEEISDEIPKLDGAELLCRKDYFEIICEYYETEPYYYTTVVVPEELRVFNNPNESQYLFSKDSFKFYDKDSFLQETK